MDTMTQIAGTIGLNIAPALTAMEHFRKEVGRVNAAILSMQKLSKQPIGLAAQLKSEAKTATAAATAITNAERKKISVYNVVSESRKGLLGKEQSAYKRHLAEMGGIEEVGRSQQMRIAAQHYSRAQTQQKRFMLRSQEDLSKTLTMGKQHIFAKHERLARKHIDSLGGAEKLSFDKRLEILKQHHDNAAAEYKTWSGQEAAQQARQAKQMIAQEKKLHSQRMDIARADANAKQYFIDRQQKVFERHVRMRGGLEKLSHTELLQMQRAHYNRAIANYQRFVGKEKAITAQRTNAAKMAESMVGRRLGWFLSGTALFGGFGIAQQVVQAVGGLEQQMLRIQKVSVDQHADFEMLRDDLIQLGIQYGQTADQVMESAIIWAQAGYLPDEIKELTRVSTLSQIVADMPAEESVRLLIAALKQFGMEADEAINVLDKANEVSNRFAVTAQDVFHAIAQTGQMAKMAGLSIDELIGYIVALTESTGRSGKEVGNALKSIFAFSQRPKAIEYFESLGVAVVDAEGNYRNFHEVFLDLSKKWVGATNEQKEAFAELVTELDFTEEAMGELSDVEKTQLAQMGANLFRRNYFISLMENMSTAINATKVSTESLGSAEREHALFAESYAVKLNQLKAAFADLAVQIGEAGLLDVMKGLVDGTREAVTAFEQLPERLQNLIINATILGSILGLTTLTLRTFAGVGLGQVVIRLANLVLKMKGATVAAQTMGQAFLVLGRTPLFVALTTLAGAAYAGYKAFKKFREEGENLSETFADNADKAKNKKEQIEKLTDEYLNLAKKTDKSAEETEKQRQLFEQIVELVPKASAGMDAHGSAVENVGKVYAATRIEVENLTAAMLRNAQLSADIARNEDLPRAQKKYEEAQRKLREAQEASRRGPEPERPYRFTSIAYDEWILGGTEKARAIHAAKEQERISKERTALAKAEQAALNELTKAKEEVNKAQQRVLLPGIYEAQIRGGGEWDKWNYPVSTTPFVGRNDGGDDTDDPSTPSSSPTPTWLQKFSDALEEAVPPEVIRSLYQAEDALARINSRASTLSETQSHLTWKFQEGIATTEDFTKLQGVLAEKSILLTQEQDLLASVNETLKQQLPHLNRELQVAVNRYDEMRRANNVEGMREANEAYDKARQKIAAVNAEIDKNTKALYENERALHGLNKAMDELYNQQFDKAMQQMQYLSSIARLTTEEQIYYLKRLSAVHEWETSKQMQLNQELFNHYRSELDKEMDAIREAYDDRIALIDKETQAKIDAIQKEIDALDEEDRLNDREKSREDHEKKIQELLEKRRYHEIRTGREHEEAIFDIDKQIQEERQRWEEEQRRWDRDDKKKSLQEEIKDVQDASNEKKKELERYYNQALKLLNSATRDMLATLALENDKWFGQGKSWADRLVEGFRSGESLDSILADIQRGIDAARGAAKSIPPSKGKESIEDIIGDIEKGKEQQSKQVAFIPAGSYVEKNGTAYMAAKSLGNLLNASVSWDNAKKIATIGGKSFSPGWIDNGTAYVPIRQVAQALGYKVSWDKSGISIDQAHTGAYVKSTGVAELLKGERVLSPKLTVSFDRLAGVLEKVPTNHISNMGNFDRAADRIVKAIEQRMGVQIDRLLNIEKFINEDQTDVNALTNVIRRAVNNWR